MSFGLVNIPVNLYPASEASEEISFRQLHRKDLAPIQYRCVCSAEGTEVPWGEIVKGFEYAKGEVVVMTDEDIAKARVEATRAIGCNTKRPSATGNVTSRWNPREIGRRSRGSIFQKRPDNTSGAWSSTSWCMARNVERARASSQHTDWPAQGRGSPAGSRRSSDQPPE